MTETQPDGYGDTTDVVGSEGGTLADDEISAISLGAGVDATDYDFIETFSSLAGTVEVDDGTPIEGVTITLTGTDINGDPVSETTTTDEFGNCLFDGLLAGEYTVTETQPDGFDDETDVVGSEGGVLANDEISAIPLGAGVDATDYDLSLIHISEPTRPY